jgi:hypothetical protein
MFLDIGPIKYFGLITLDFYIGYIFQN